MCSKSANRTATALVIYENSDIDSAIRYLTLSMKYPNRNENFISSVYVEEAVKNKFLEKINVNLCKIKPIIAEERYGKFLRSFECAIERITEVRAKTYKGLERILLKERKIYPLLVCNFFHKNLLSSADTGGCIVTFHTFRHGQDLLQLIEGEDPEMVANLSIWQSNYGRAFAVALAAKAEFYLLNCFRKVDSALLRSIDCNQVFIKDNYHYECIQSNDILKRIVFPISVNSI